MKLIALDLDGTLFNNKSQISKENIKAIKEATAAGINVVISTGRPFGGLPFEAIKNTGIRYAITANGSAIYEIDTKKCLYENCLSDETAFSIIDNQARSYGCLHKRLWLFSIQVSRGCKGSQNASFYKGIHHDNQKTCERYH